MKKIYKISNLDCAVCAQKIQDEVSKIKGVNEVRVNYLTKKFTLDACDSDFDRLFNEAVRVAKEIEPDCIIEL